MAKTPDKGKRKAPERRIILKIPESVIQMALAAKLPSWVPDTFTARVCWIVAEWFAGRGRKGVRRRAEASEPESEAQDGPITE